MAEGLLKKNFISFSDTELQVIGSPSQTLEEFVVAYGNFMRGEPIFYALYTRDKKTCISGTIVPYPLEVHGKNGETLSMELIDPTGKMFKFFLKGMKANETCSYTTYAAEEKIREKVQVNEN